MENAPGPISASAAATPISSGTPNPRGNAARGACAHAIATIAPISTLAGGVMNPINTHRPAPADRPAISHDAGLPAPASQTALRTTAIDAAARNSRMPTPGAPPGNAENNRCTAHSVTAARWPRNPQAGGIPYPFRVADGALKVKDAAADRNRDRLRAVLCAQFLQDVLHVHLDRLFGYRQPRRDVAVLVPLRRVFEDESLALGERLVGAMFGELR